MKRLATVIVFSALLAACGRASSTPTAVPRVSPGGPTTAVAVATTVLSSDTPPGTPAPTPAPLHTQPPARVSPTGPLPRIVSTITLGQESDVCAGGAMAVDPDTGYLYTAGTDDAQGKPCLTVIDPTTDQVLGTHELPFEPRFLRWDRGTLYAIGRGDGALIVANADEGQIVAREFVGEDLDYQTETQVVTRDGWIYVGLPGDPTTGTDGVLYLIPVDGGPTRIIRDARAFDLANDGRFAVVGGQTGTTVRVYVGTNGALLAEREIGPGEPGASLAFDGWTDRIFISRRQGGSGDASSRHLVDVLDATSLETLSQMEETAWRLTADPRRGRVYAYGAESRIIGFDTATGEPLGTLFSIPQAEPTGFTTIRPAEKLHIEPTSGHITVIYEDFDGGTWVARFDPATGEGVADVQVPPGAPWTEDAAFQRAYFGDQDFLLALDAVTLRPVWRVALSHTPVSAAIAPDRGLLFVGDAGGDVHVRDLGSYEEVDLLSGVGGYVDVDVVHGWLYAGDKFAAGVSVYDLETLETRGTIPQPGRPTASPADAQVYILEEGVYRGDGETLALIEGRTTRNAGCNGCTAPTSVVADPRSGLIHVTTYGTQVGKPGPTSHVAIDPTTGRAFAARTTGGYRVVYTLATYADLALEQALAWRDGLYGQPMYNPATGDLYLTDGSRLLVLEGETLDLIGWLYPSGEGLIPGAVDVHSGRFYLLAGQQVLALDGTGGRFETPSPQPVAGIPGPPEGIVPLPDGTLFVRAYDRETYASGLYRSTDGGQTWVELNGGLPGAPNDLASTSGGTLYAAVVPTAWRAETEDASWGEGVYRSDDGGDTWVPLSQGLAHLRVSRIHADAGSQVHVLSTGTWPEQKAWPVPTIWRLDEGERWTQVEPAGAGPAIGPDGAVPYAYTQAVQTAWHALTGGGMRYRSWGSDLQRSSDGGLNWETISVGPVDYGVETFTGVGQPPAIYWLTWDALYRSTDGGARWARLSHPTLAGSPPVAVAVAEWDGEETLFVGTEGGDLLVIRAAEADWLPE